MSTQAAPNPTLGTEREEPPFPPALVEELLKLLVKGVRAHQLYLHNNPIYLRALELLAEGLNAIWQHAEEIALAFTETEIRWSTPMIRQCSSRSTTRATNDGSATPGLSDQVKYGKPLSRKPRRKMIAPRRMI